SLAQHAICILNIFIQCVYHHDYISPYVRDVKGSDNHIGSSTPFLQEGCEAILSASMTLSTVFMYSSLVKHFRKTYSSISLAFPGTGWSALCRLRASSGS
ncbi:hypothetical protein PENTCL1PPCAC_899, partial [Pristionchus entomophagus]